MKDVGGYEEAKLEVIEYINFVNHQERYKKLGARMPKGALLVGPPGTGKTLLARATAGEANIPFIACSSASLLLGSNGAEKLREIFKFAYDKAPCVLFFDEIDCIGRSRNHELAKPETQCLTEELLVQLDGFEQRTEKLLIILASTNHQSDLDEALMRPGRFDRVIQMPSPDLPARMAIMNVHLKPLTTSLDKVFLAKRFAILTAGFTGAQIAALCNESAMIAARDLNEEIKMPHFEQALERVRSGIKKKRPMTEEEKIHFARHDAAHAVAGWFLKGSTPPTKLCILPNASNKVDCSVTSCPNLPPTTRLGYLNNIATALAGAASEEIFYGEYQTNCSNDMRLATVLALKFVTEFGMTETLGKVYLKSIYVGWNQEGNEKFRPGNEVFGKVFAEVKKTLDECFEIAKSVLRQHQDQLEEIAQLLAKKDLLTLDMLVDVLGPSPHIDMDKLTLEDADFLPPGLAAWNEDN